MKGDHSSLPITPSMVVCVSCSLDVDRLLRPSSQRSQNPSQTGSMVMVRARKSVLLPEQRRAWPSREKTTNMLELVLHIHPHSVAMQLDEGKYDNRISSTTCQNTGHGHRFSTGTDKQREKL
mmetsp:Transcript_37177/g.90167  ORF Transcript_37177/g.90167 Transcript_37177/m.90167 type:complete len:122 (+) Transcript_37177:164-529(+)